MKETRAGVGTVAVATDSSMHMLSLVLTAIVHYVALPLTLALALTLSLSVRSFSSDWLVSVASKLRLVNVVGATVTG